MGHDKVKTSTPAAADRADRLVSRKRRCLDMDAANSLLFLSDDVANLSGIDPIEQCIDIAIQTDVPTLMTCEVQTETPTGIHSGEQTDLSGELIEAMQSEINRLTVENLDLHAKVASFEFTEKAFVGNDDRVRFLTGLPTFVHLHLLFGLVSSHISVTAQSSLSGFQQLVLVLLKLRLDLPIQFLGFLFSVSHATASRTFNTVLDVLFKRTMFLIKWPSREELQLTMPGDFLQSFGNRVAVIIDCFEVFTDRPTNLMARAQTWSNYKHHNTIKLLIGITPQGSVSFISKAWGGRASDKKITEESGFLDKLIPGDIVLADRGFNISESVGMQCAELKIPAFLRGKKQLSVAEVMDTRKIAHVRIHVERVIGCIRQRFGILGGPIPNAFIIQKDQDGFTIIDKIVHVSCALNNMCKSCVPLE